MKRTITHQVNKKRKNVLLLVVLLSLFSFGKLLAQPLNGAYTVGSSGNYATLTAALAALNTNGVSGPVTLNILPGTTTVTTTIAIGTYTGVDATNPLVIQGTNVDSVIFTGNIATGAIITLNQCKYVTLRNITVINSNTTSCSGVGIIGSTTNNNGVGCSVRSCKISLPGSSTSFVSACLMTTTAVSGYGTVGQVRIDSLSIDSNRLTGGYYSLYLYGPTGITGLYNREYKIRNNTILNSQIWGIYISTIQNGIDLIDNTITVASTATYGIHTANCYNHFSGHNSHRLINNRVYNAAYSYFNSNLTGLAVTPTLIYNNVAVNRGGASTNYGLYLTSTSTYVASYNIYHNTMRLPNCLYGYSLYYSNANAGNVLSCQNNIFALDISNAGYYPAYFVQNPANPTGGQAINNNVYNSVGASSTNIIYRAAAYNTSNYNTSTAGGDSSSIGTPSFASAGFDGHLADGCNRLGSPIGSFYVPTDMDGQTRSTTAPLVGADEFMGVNNNLKAEVILAPGMPISTGSQDLIFRVKNVGSNSVSSFNASYTLNSGTPVTMAYSGTLNACDTVSMVFTGTNQINLGASNAIKVYTAAPNSSADADPTNDTISVLYKAPLNGIYTVGTGGNYPNLIAAAADLANGVAGPVTFKVLPGTYAGQVVVNGPIPGASSINTVTFDGDTASTRIVTATVGGAAAFLINQASFVKLRNLTIINTASGAVGAAIVGSGSNSAGSGSSISRCIISMPNAGTSTSYGISISGSAGGYGQANHNMDSITIDSNTVTNGYFGISVQGNTIGNATYNRFFKIRGNNVVTPYMYGMYIYYIYNAIDVLNNSIVFANPSTVGYGLYIYYCYNSSATPTNIIGNRVDGAAYYGMYLYMPTGTSPLVINNNVVGRTTYAYNYQMYLYAVNSSFVTFLHNTLVQDFTQQGATYGPLVAYFPSNAIIKNNIFSCTAATGPQTPCYLYQAPTGSNSLNNNIYWNAANNTTLLYRGSNFGASNFNTATAGGDSSLNVDPKFVSNTNLQVTTCFTGGNFTSLVPTDILGAIRNVPPKIGAYENVTPLSYLSSNTIQRTGAVAPGATDFPVLRIPVVYTGCGNSFTTEARFNTVGTTAVGNIVSAKLYQTGSAANFNTNKLLATVFSPSGQFVFTFTDTINRNTGDTINYWLAYDVSSSATTTNTLDARIDSIYTVGAYRIPSNNNPTGNLVVTAPMTYLSSTANHPTNLYIVPGSVSNQMLRIMVRTSSVGSPIAVTNFNLNTIGGGQDTLNLLNAKLYYTGNSNAFSTANLFGTYTPTGLTTAQWAPYSITGNQQLVNDTNYFWLTYDSKTGAVIGDSADAEVTGITISGTTQTPTVTAPAGYRKFRNDYCVSTASSTFDEEIWNVTFGSINNTSTCTTTGGPGSTLSMYSNYTATVAAAAIPAGIPTPVSVLTGSCNGNYSSFLVIYIDYNQDGLFTGTGELAYSSGTFTGSNLGVLRTGTITVPCTALQGITRMRVVYVETTATPPSCGTYTWGETEDYNINIVNGPATFTSTNALQITGATSAGATDVPVLRVPVKVTASPCNPGVITELRFNTAGTSSVGNIVSAKLYKTGTSNVFNNTNLLGTVFSPSGQFSFAISDTANNDTNNYWLAYDISSTAANGATLDARYDSVQAFGSYYLPINGNPTGSRVVAVPMSFIGASAIHPDLSVVETNSTNNRMLRIMVRTSSSGSPVTLTQFSLNTNGGGADTLNINNAKIFYTGSSATFAATTQFGSTYTVSGPTSATWPSYTISGTQPLGNDTNYFWLTYDIKSGAVLNDSVDAEVTGLIFGGVSQTPTVTAPAGSRRIRAPYCASTATLTGDEDIFGVQFGTMNNTSGCTTTAPGPGSVNQFYANYTTSVAAPSIPAGIATPIYVTKGTCGGFYGEVISVYIDYNQDGVFSTAENAWTSSYATGTANQVITGSVTIPCTATPGITRMRVVYVEGTAAPACGTYGWGETEDYNINIVNGPASYTSANTIQSTGSVLAGATDVTILRVPVRVSSSSCNPGIISELRFNTSGTSSVSNIVSAKLYKTPNNVFATTNLLGTVFSPSGQFVFTLSDTAVNDTNNYWLTYDVATTATNGATLDASIDSILVFGTYRIPTGNNPTGNVLVSVPMTYTGSTTIHPDLGKVETGSVNNRILRMYVQTSATGASINATAFSFNTTGTPNPTTNISNAKVFYTGSSTTFASTTQVGTTVASPNGAFTITGNTALGNGDNYFWLTYDIPTGATLGDSVDAVVNTITVGGVTQTPTITSPAGSRQIRAPYCISSATATGDEEILGVAIGTFSNTSNCTSLAGGPGSSTQLYGNYTNLTGPTMRRGDYATINVTIGTCGGFYGEVVAAYIDYNQNGLFDVNENVYTSAYATGTANQVKSGTFLIPMNTPLGTTRLRVVYVEGTAAPACGTYTWGETEDYNITIEDPAYLTYTWTGATSTNAVVAGNWNPTRITPNITDKVIFDNTSAITLTNVQSSICRTLQLTNATVLNMSGTIGTNVNVSDSLQLGTLARLNTGNTTVTLGTDTINAGVIAGSGRVMGTLARWTNSSMANITLPLTDATNANRNVVVTYATKPAIANTITASFIPTAPTTFGLPVTNASITANKLGETGYWSLNTSMTGGSYTGVFNAAGFKGISNFAQLLLVNRASSVSSWGTIGTHVATSGSNAAPVLSRTGMNSYGEFAVGGDSTVNPLPVSMLFFNASNVNGDVQLKWATANEINNKGFAIERSIDGINFTEIGFVKGFGNSNTTRQYGSSDLKAFTKAGISILYYRLRQVDFDGNFEYSNVVLVDENAIIADQVKVFPNPFVTSVGVTLEVSESTSAQIELLDMQGRVLSVETVKLTTGNNYYDLKGSNNMSSGVYFVNVNLNGVKQSFKVTKLD